jgi:hypothetical protein
MSFKKRYPDFAGIEHHIRQAQAERTLYIATRLADLLFASFSGLKRLVTRVPVATPLPPSARPVARY